MSVLHLLAEPTSIAAGYELGVGRLVPSVAAVVGLISVVVGWLALARAGNKRVRAIVALTAGVISVVVGGLHGANAAGGLGTGNGLAGAIIAVVLGLAGMVIGGLALARSRITS
jgi:hypothetical protein